MSETVLNKSILEEFKESELGRLPKSWEVKSLGDISSFRRGSFPQPYGNPEWYSKEGYPFVQVYDIAENNRLKASTKVRISEAAASQSVFIPKGSLIVSLQGSIGRVAITQYDSYVDRTILIFSNFESKLDTNYFSTIIRELFRNKSVVADGGIIKTITKETLRKFKIKIPPLPEQKKITSILNSVEEVIEKTQSQINKLQDLKKGTMNELLTKGIGHTEFKDSELGRIPKSWEVKPLLKLTKGRFGIVDGPFGSNLKTEHYKSEGIPVIQSGFVTTGQFRAKKYVYVDDEKFNAEIRSAVKNGDIVMAKIGAQAGRCAIMPTGHPTGILAGNSLKITTDEESLLAKYLQNLLSHLYITGEIQNLRTETAQPAISIATLKRYKVKVPSLLEQHKIIEVLSAIETKLESSKEKSEKFQFLKKSLMQDLLTGKVRVTVN